MVSPCIFFVKKLMTFLVALEVTTFLKLIAPLRLPLDRLSSILSKFSSKNLTLTLGCYTLGWCHPGRSVPFFRPSP